MGDIHAVHQDAAAVGLVQAGHQAHQTGLAGQGATEQHVERAGLETQVGIVDPGLAFDDAGDMFQGQ